MLTDKKILPKVERLEETYAGLRFHAVGTVPVAMWETERHFRAEPSADDGATWTLAPAGTTWGGDGITAWFQGNATLPAACQGRRVFVRILTNAVSAINPGSSIDQTLLFVDGREAGVFDPNHPIVLLTPAGKKGAKHRLAFESYSGHSFPGTQPFEGPSVIEPKCKRFGGVELILEREDVSAFVFDLRTLLRLIRTMDDNSLRKNQILRALAGVYTVVDMFPAETGEASWRPKLAAAQALMRPLLARRNSPTTPWAGLVGHSHIDTAWLWTLAETWRKCARTFSSVLNLMEQYPEMTFVQSQPCQTEVMRREYPGLFQRIQAMAKAGRWEPNGAMWCEPDCNIPSGEAFVRQLLVGQQATREFFGYTSDTLWLPDVFGYSAALPQLLRGAGVEFFCTTKMSWNDTTRFPYEAFVWKGMDGTPVVAHLNRMHCWPDPQELVGQWHWYQHKDVQDRWLCAYGFGDGGGGPMHEMLEAARRITDLEGCPKTRHTTVGEFMRGLRDDLGPDLPEWVGELYLELHRGTLTSVARVKRGNRRTEFALREAEFLCAAASLNGHGEYPHSDLKELWKELLTNQFHDILPGSSIAAVNDEAIASFTRLTARADDLAQAALARVAGKPAAAVAKTQAVLVANSLSWPRLGEIAIAAPPAGLVPADAAVASQRVTTVDGRAQLLLSGVGVPALGASLVRLKKGPETAVASPFTVKGATVDTPHLAVRFAKDGSLASCVLKATGRELVRPGSALNVFWLGEDVPAAWDNWDIDRDQHLKMHADQRLVSRKVVADGPLQLRLRCEYSLGTKSGLVQDIVFHADTPRIDFETQLDWHEKHVLFKVGFDLNVTTDSARHEIQFGHVVRPTHANQAQDRARFEVCAHKWTDLADNGFGVALLNDCKYGVGVQGSEIRLSLLKSGTHPDPRGDEGVHLFTYALLPHAGPFSVEAVVRPAYELNLPVTAVAAAAGAQPLPSLATVDVPNVIIEAVKAPESGAGLVLRLYEAGGASATATVRLPQTTATWTVEATNLLEEDGVALPVKDNAVRFDVHPFAVKTLVCRRGP
jgi:alpha-mannosidase